MKKHIFWIAPIVLYIILAILNQEANYFNTTWFNVKHVLLFGLIVYVLLMDLYLVYRFFIKRYPTKKVLKYLLILLLSGISIYGMILTSNLQIKYIDLYEVPQIKKTTYYDRYGNVIYRSILEESPDLNIIENNYDSLSFTVEENYQGNMSSFITVDNGVGSIYYPVEITIKTFVDIIYRGPSVESLSYTVYETITSTSSLEPSTTGYINSTLITNDFSNSDVMTTTYERRILEVDLENENYPELESIEPVITKHVSTLVFPDENDGDFRIIFDEITYDDEENEVVNTFAHGNFDTSNESYIFIDFYEDGLFIGNRTYYSFQFGNYVIKNVQERSRTSGLEVYYDERTVEFGGLPTQFQDEQDELNNIFTTDIFMFESFTADLQSSWGNPTYDKTFSFREINNEIFVKDNQGYYHKFIYTDYGIMAQEFRMKTFNYDEFFGQLEEPEYEYMKDALSYYIIHDLYITDILNAYSYQSMITSPGGLSNFHFYQHNYLIEHFFIDNYQKFDK